jgi:predicted RNase H-like nuclease (RuvC/YqgF family)
MTTKAEREAQQLAQVQDMLTKAVQAAVEPLAQRISALETALDGARRAYGELRAQVQGTRVQARVESSPRLPIGEWNRALNSLREERGLNATAFVARNDVLQRAAELREAAE